MFQRLTSLFFSDGSAPEGAEQPKPFVSQEQEEDGWLIIDLAGEKRSRVGCRRPPAPALPEPCLMDESWFVTPPPCFTAEGSGLAGLESSPMEDLLIEHPSMSVYVTSSSLLLDGDSPEEASDGAGVSGWVAPGPSSCSRAASPCVRREELERRPERRAPPRSTSLAAVVEPARPALRLQRARQRAEKPGLSHKALQRQNRARERPARRPRQHGARLLHQPRQRHRSY
ncbi:T53I2 protein, partial [Eudromia elegans]|nr:T53I2 protein [Eudromia elegans]